MSSREVYALTPLVGVDIHARTTTPSFDVGTVIWGQRTDDPNNQTGVKMVYVQANGAIAADQVDVAVTTAGQASDGSGAYENAEAFADNEYGWIWNSGF